MSSLCKKFTNTTETLTIAYWTDFKASELVKTAMGNIDDLDANYAYNVANSRIIAIWRNDTIVGYVGFRGVNTSSIWNLENATLLEKLLFLNVLIAEFATISVMPHNKRDFRRVSHFISDIEAMRYHSGQKNFLTITQQSFRGKYASILQELLETNNYKEIVCQQ